MRKPMLDDDGGGGDGGDGGEMKKGWRGGGGGGEEGGSILSCLFAQLFSADLHSTLHPTEPLMVESTPMAALCTPLPFPIYLFTSVMNQSFETRPETSTHQHPLMIY